MAPREKEGGGGERVRCAGRERKALGRRWMEECRVEGGVCVRESEREREKEREREREREIER
jgi:hypothetical protein